MAMDFFQVNLPTEFLPLFNSLDGTNIDSKVKVSLAIGLFVEKQVTLAKAAELSGKTLGEFIDLLRSKQIPWVEYNEEHLKDDELVIFKNYWEIVAVKKSKIITNSTPIIGLSILGQLHLLAELFEEVYIPEAVYNEIVHSDTPRRYGKNELKTLVSMGTFTLYAVENSDTVKKLYGRLHEGELEVIVGAKELDLQFVAIDEHAARTMAKLFL